MIVKGKVKCDQCGWTGTYGDVLHAPNPFDTEEGIDGCTDCKSVGSIIMVCDEGDCMKYATCGWPSPKGYRNTCGEHFENE